VLVEHAVVELRVLLAVVARDGVVLAPDLVALVAGAGRRVGGELGARSRVRGARALRRGTALGVDDLLRVDLERADLRARADDLDRTGLAVVRRCRPLSCSHHREGTPWRATARS
jgi:hypothetical protein